MKISRAIGYAILAVGYLAQHKEEGIILSQDVSKQYNIPLEYLVKILQQLVKSNILHSKRGPRGGFSLARPPKKITLLEVIEAVEGPMVSRLDLAEHARGEKLGAKLGARAERIYKEALAQAGSILGKTKLSDLLEG